MVPMLRLLVRGSVNLLPDRGMGLLLLRMRLRLLMRFRMSCLRPWLLPLNFRPRHWMLLLGLHGLLVLHPRPGFGLRMLDGYRPLFRLWPWLLVLDWLWPRILVGVR